LCRFKKTLTGSGHTFYDASVPTDERALLDEIVYRLNEKHDQLTVHQVAAVVQQEYAQFARSRVREYIPLLVERRADKHLATCRQIPPVVAGAALAAPSAGNAATADREALRITEAEVADARVLTVSGLLDSWNYFQVRDKIIKASLNQPRAIIVDVSNLTAARPSVWSVLTSAGWQIERPPDLPMAVVCDNRSGQEALRRNGISRYLAVYRCLDTAIAELLGGADCTYRRRAKAVLPNLNSSVGQARELVEQWLTTWSRADDIAVATTVAAELVERVLAHTGGAFALRLEAERDSVKVSAHSSDVAAADAPWAAEPLAAEVRAQGSNSTSGGHVLWAVIGPENRR
jgi:hypothetical protein